jgi:hypothetical protein
MAPEQSYTTTDAKLDQLLGKMDEMITSTNELLHEFHRNSDVLTLQITHVKEELATHDTHFEKQASINAAIFTRLDKLEKRCLLQHAYDSSPGSNNNISSQNQHHAQENVDANNLWTHLVHTFQSKLGQLIFWAVSVAVTVYLTKLIGRLP